MDILGWDRADVIIVSGDAYIDSPFCAAAVIGKYLLKHGFRTAVISQPDIHSEKDIAALGEPRLFWGVSAGCVDSMVANYTSLGKPRKICDFTPGGVNNRRPDRASIVYTGLIRRFFKKTKPIVLGGIEASLRRVAHYDFKTDKVRRSILFDAKADYIIYGMGELPVLELAVKLSENENPDDIRGLCRISDKADDDALPLPSFEEVSADKFAFHKMFKIFSDNSDGESGKKMYQPTGDRFLIHNPPPVYSDTIMDEISDISFERAVHPLIKGKVKAEETIKHSIISHRGCFGGCSFCAITVHQGRKVVTRSIASVMKEADEIVKMKNFNGIISDIGGPTGNMYGMKCPKMEKSGACRDKSCLYPAPCPSMNINHAPLLEMLEAVRNKKGVKKVFASSGIRADLVMADKDNGMRYIRALAENHVSGQLKLAPESADTGVLSAMKKPNNDSFLWFYNQYSDYSRKIGKRQFISCYFMAAHPYETMKEAENTRKFIDKYLKFSPEQVQIFTPSPSTWAACAYFTGMDESGAKIYSEKLPSKKEEYKSVITGGKKTKKKRGARHIGQPSIHKHP